LIDDEPHALKELEFHIKRYSEIEICSMFTNPVEALDRINEFKPDVVFMDINMPQIQGIDCASFILDKRESIDIIFVTAYNEYAVQAFELNALDYILKPISDDRFYKTISRLLFKHNQKQVVKIKEPDRDKRLKIQCLGKFQIQWQAQEPLRWRTQKNRELFAFLLHHQGVQISKDTIIDAVFPDIAHEAATSQLYSSIYYIRKTLESYGIKREEICINGKYSMCLGDVDFDRQMFEKEFSNIYDAFALDDLELENLESRESIYKGDYFEGADWAWAYSYRQKLSKYHIDLVVKISKEQIKLKAYIKAEDLLRKAFNKELYDEQITCLLMNLYKITGQKSKAKKHFLLYERLLKEELGIKPEEQIIELCKRIKISPEL